MQETNLVLWQKFDQFQIGTDFRAWACKIARFEVFNHWADERRGGLHFSDQMLEQVATHIDRDADYFEARRNALLVCLERISASDRELIERRYQPGMSSGRLAQAVGRPAASLYKTLSRIRKALLDCIRRRLSQEEAAS